MKRRVDYEFDSLTRSFLNGVKAGIWFGRGMSDKQLIAIQTYIKREEEKISNG